MGVIRWLDGQQRRRSWAGLPLAVVYKMVDDQATFLAAMITYYGFLSLFPVLLLLVTLLGFALSGNAELQQQVLHSALRDFPIIGDQIGGNIHSLQGSTFGLVVGIVGGLYGALGVGVAAQNAMNKIWAVPRAQRPALPGLYGRSAAPARRPRAQRRGHHRPGRAVHRGRQLGVGSGRRRGAGGGGRGVAARQRGRS